MPRREGEITLDEHRKLITQGKQAWYVYDRDGSLVHYYASAIHSPEDRLGTAIMGFKNYFHAFACYVQIKAQIKELGEEEI